MMRPRSGWAWWWVVLIAWNAASVCLGVMTGSRIAAFIAGVGLGISAGMFVVTQRRDRERGHRQAQGNRQDQGASASGVSSGARVGTLGIGASSPDIGAALPERESDETIVGYKLAYLELAAGQLRFAGIGNGRVAPYGVEATALCADRYNSLYFGGRYDRPQPCDHVPNLTHTCGFYAVANPPDPGNYTVVLEVEMFGTVIVHEYGWRAEKQRVLSVRFPKVCASGLCGRDATLVAETGTGDGSNHLVGLCDEHAALISATALCAPAPLAQIASLLGTEVRWAS